MGVLAPYINLQSGNHGLGHNNWYLRMTCPSFPSNREPEKRIGSQRRKGYERLIGCILNHDANLGAPRVWSLTRDGVPGVYVLLAFFSRAHNSRMCSWLSSLPASAWSV